jgi:hypothetical protein
MNDWTPDQPLRADATDVQIAERAGYKAREFDVALRAERRAAPLKADGPDRLVVYDRGVVFAAREFAKAAIEAYDIEQYDEEDLT